MSNPPKRCSKRGLDKETDHTHTNLSRIERTTKESQLLLIKLEKEKHSAMNCLANINNLKMSNPPNGPSKHRLDEETYHTDLSPTLLAKLLQEKRSAMICIAKLQTVLAEMDLLLAENITMMEFDVIKTSKRLKKDKPEAVLPEWDTDLQDHTVEKLTENQLNITKRFIYYDDEDTLPVPEIKPSNDKCLQSDEIIQTTTKENKTSTTKKVEQNKSKQSRNKSNKHKREDKKQAKN